jgi:hypothetical protein
MSIGSVPGSTAPVAPDPATAPTAAPTPSNPTTTAPVQPRTTTPTGRAAVGASVTAAAEPKASDIVPAGILSKYGLDPNKLTTESKYDGEKWSVGYYPYSGDIQYVAFGKYASLFNNPNGAQDAHAYWEAYSNPPSGLTPGSWIHSGSISESNFEDATGVDITGDRPIDNDAYRLMREAGAPAEAKFALRDSAGKQLALKSGDRLVPTLAENGKQVEVEVRDDGDYYKKGTSERVDDAKVVWRLKGADGQIRGAASDKVEDRFALAGARPGVKFDFLDETGEVVPREAGDQIVATYKDGDAWHAFVPKKDAQGNTTWEHQTLDKDGQRVTARETVTEARMKDLERGKEVIYRIQSRSGALKGDGKVGDAYDMGWWGKCHNVASIGASSMKLPERDVKIITNRQYGDKVALEYTAGSEHHVLIPNKDRNGKVRDYTDQIRNAQGGVASSKTITADEATRVANEKQATPVLVTRSGALKKAEVTTVGKEETTAMVAHMGDGAVEYLGSVGSRYYGYPDQVKLKDGSVKGAFITNVTLDSGKKVAVGSKSGTGEYDERDRSVLRGPGLQSRRVNSGYRQLAWSQQDFAQLQSAKSDKIKSVEVTYPDGHTETIPADKIQSIGWENKFDVTPTELWGMHKNIGAKGSWVIEQDPGPHVWNYTIESMSTKPLKPSDLSASEKEAAKKPGMMAGTTDENGRYYFETRLNYHDYKYWAKFDAQGNMTDYGYLSADTPDFFWGQHVKDPIKSKWTGEAQAPGARMEDIQKVYNASIGALKPYELPGGYIAQSDLSRTPVEP